MRATAGVKIIRTVIAVGSRLDKPFEGPSDGLTEACHEVDPESTEHTIELSHADDVVEGETAVVPVMPTKPTEPEGAFRKGIFD
jgi:hypothetical protein